MISNPECNSQSSGNCHPDHQQEHTHSLVRTNKHFASLDIKKSCVRSSRRNTTEQANFHASSIKTPKSESRPASNQRLRKWEFACPARRQESSSRFQSTEKQRWRPRPGEEPNRELPLPARQQKIKTNSNRKATTLSPSLSTTTKRSTLGITPG